jgi:uncharacterized metal-binding protein
MWQPWVWGSDLWQLLQVHAEMLFWIGMGLELGSVNHSLRDWMVSRWKRWRRKRRQVRSPARRLSYRG